MTPRRDRVMSAGSVADRAAGMRTRRAPDGITLLTIYLVLLFAIPSDLTITAMGSLGRPSLIWGLLLLVFWAITRLQRRSEVRPVVGPSRVSFAFACFLVLALISFAAALLRGQPDDQVSPALTGIVRLLSWGGVLLVAVDAVRKMDDLERMTRRMVIATGLLAALGIAQFVTGQTLLDFFDTIPGTTTSGGGVVERSGLTRASGTAIHPLEYASTLCGVLPLAVATALSRGFRRQRRSGIGWWLPVVLIAISALVGVSRSAIIGFALAAVGIIPAIPRRFRLVVVVAGLVLTAVVIASLPGLLGTTLGLFTSAGTDPSAQSRVGGLTKIPQFISASPVIGVGFGTFLPRYYIFDDEWVLLTIEVGVLGVAAFAALLLSAGLTALAARRRLRRADSDLLGYALVVSVLVMAVMFAFFDGLSFPISAGTLFLVLGLCGGMRNFGRLGPPGVSADGVHVPHSRGRSAARITNGRRV